MSSNLAGKPFLSRPFTASLELLASARMLIQLHTHISRSPAHTPSLMHDPGFESDCPQRWMSARHQPFCYYLEKCYWGGVNVNGNEKKVVMNSYCMPIY